MNFSYKTSDQVNKISESLASNQNEQERHSNTSKSLVSETKAEIVKSRNENAKGFAILEAELKPVI